MSPIMPLLSAPASAVSIPATCVLRPSSCVDVSCVWSASASSRIEVMFMSSISEVWSPKSVI